MSFLLNKEMAEAAVRIVQPSILEFLGRHEGEGTPSLHVVVLDPGTEDVLYETLFGGARTEWKAPYDEIARSKARVCQRTGMIRRDVSTDAPWLLEEGDSRYVGGVIENGLVVAASGLKNYHDEMFSWMIFAVIQGLCRGDLEEKATGHFYES